MSASDRLERVLRRDRAVVISALSVIIVAGWVYVLRGAGMGMSALDMSSFRMALGLPQSMEMGASAMAGGGMTMAGTMSAMATPAEWTPAYAVLMFFMWWIMMIAMMLPSAAPMILLHVKVARKGRAEDATARLALGTFAFTFGYLASWAVFSVVAVALQWSFEATGLLSPMMLNATSTVFAGVILIVAGLYQLTPLKQACLRHCRGPISFLSLHWRDGAGGALVMGLHHGAFCLGCCWGLMAVLFFGGVMNLYWIIGLAVIVLLEKLLPIGPRIGMVTGGLLAAWGSYFLYEGLIAAGI